MTPIFMLNSLLKIIFILIAVAYYTAAERKVMGSIHRRRGPNVTGLWGLLQPVADGVKLVLKGLIVPSQAVKHIFLFAPVAIFAFSLTVWIVLPGYLIVSETLGDRILTFLNIWTLRQWLVSLLGMGGLYYFAMLRLAQAWCDASFKTSKVSPRLVLFLIVLDFTLNMLLGFLMVEFGNPASDMYLLMHKCPIALSPIIYIMSMIWLFIHINKTFKNDKK